MIQPETDSVHALLLERNDWVPNNPRLPVLIYSKAVAIRDEDPASEFEKTFAENGWPPQWRADIFNYHHYHTQGHEVLGIASGKARLIIGGPDGQILSVSAGDVLLLPAGTGHCSLKASNDFLVVGAYPPGQHPDICRESPSEDQLQRIKTLPFPVIDPVQGRSGALTGHWKNQSLAG